MALCIHWPKLLGKLHFGWDVSLDHWWESNITQHSCRPQEWVNIWRATGCSKGMRGRSHVPLDLRYESTRSHISTAQKWPCSLSGCYLNIPNGWHTKPKPAFFSSEQIAWCRSRPQATRCQFSLCPDCGNLAVHTRRIGYGANKIAFLKCWRTGGQALRVLRLQILDGDVQL